MNNIKDNYDFILDNMRFSYSSVNSFETCPYGFKLTYIDAEERGNNFFGEYGSFFHLVLEKYFKGELGIFELAQYYKENYNDNVTIPLPSFLSSKKEEYYRKGLEYFENFEFDKNAYDILVIEDAIETEFAGIKLVVKPDLVLHHRDSGKNILVDYKTANAYKNGKLDKKKMEGYLKQFYLYCYFLWQVKNIRIDEIDVWFVTVGQLEKIPFDAYKAQEVADWFVGVIKKIKEESEWKANNENQFFCSQLCSVSQLCKFHS